jgi:hypothetical protein
MEGVKVEECGSYYKLHLPTIVLRVPKENVKKLSNEKVLIRSPLTRKEFIAYLL